MLANHQDKPIDLVAYRNAFGFPITAYYEKIGIDLEKESFEALTKKFVANYNEGVQNCGLHNGVTDILQQLKETGIREMEIYQVGNRLFMIMETEPEFSLEEKENKDRNNPRVQEWEALMSKYQQRLPFANPEEKWVLMDQIFKL